MGFVESNQVDLRRVYVQQAIQAERGANKESWKSCLWCSRVAGKYERDSVLALADDLGKSTDTVYDRAHAYFMFEELCGYKNGTYRKLVFSARRADYIYWSHFRALWDAKTSYDLSIESVMELLIDIIQAEGTISSRSLDEHVRSRYGKEKHWKYYAQKASKDIARIIASEAVPRRLRKDLKRTLKILQDKSK
jgi:hypothetical protein